ncbi:calcium-translocating P-type ATPase, PMCA-type [Clostridium tagluense]|uniref:calcium-translocating P-type ATPase, PMCA-type n=1 Tax=Clostridium tagluense TaxID=360422 RepID=UPI001CF1BE18|nr:calcium-translocating P-type ATPase, PMCA-type [Clostridium tagluense]MCB2313504.1 calcium-translocating P-type ATPase, PMCA-type [Clostridium tagluense]MCB2318328.1 calcium-translocating P-type ATPase, PMCA-type [Clostridium tagluense]MCB2323114.1 calcium-translocating P-type ATPase, PMCA-type [Clostridium tagluense]MCB2328097.1 calcium-translocating P-type ATPase, PMCA-type [Clostridium tagluense]MCB2332831.1 calcium-translocating P-type ATPase, PMCA-type [Clostridium tagluense]
MKYFNKQSSEVLDELKVDSSVGLSSSEVKERLEKYGANEFTKQEKGSIWDSVKEAITEPMMIILLVAAVISALVGEVEDAIGIVCAVAVGIGIGIFTEGKSQKAADALSKMTENIEVKVTRNGKIIQVNKNDLVPGDMVLIETGDMVPADGRLISSIDLMVREDMLTGESEDVSKDSEVVIEMENIKSKDKNIVQDPIPAKQLNMVFGGTLVAYGRASFVVTSTGDSSQMGEIAKNLEDSDLQTPLQAKLGDLGGKISKVSSAIAAVLFIVMIVKMVMAKTISPDTSGIFAFLQSVEPIKTAFVVCVALIVAAVPEGLPTMINMTLAITMQKMAKINALVTKKEACETIGSVSVICSDKTGTLTQNRMTVEKVYLNGKFKERNELSDGNNYFIDNCLVNSTADIQKEGKEVKYLGSATECALLLYNDACDYVQQRQSAKIAHQIPFSSKRKRMSTVIEGEDGSTLLTKGAPEIVLELCKYEHVNCMEVELDEARRREISNEIEKLQKKSMRVLGFAYRNIDEEVAMASEQGTLENDLVFTGFVGIKDPLRLDVKEAVETARNAGVATKMLTGDNINTAIAIGEELGLLNGKNRAVEASYIDTLTDEELRQEITTISIVARSKPDTKMRIVIALQNNGEVVAVTGDGINDAPALTKADVGIAMGIAGTEVSKNAADIILTDDSFGTIVKGIKWGRGIYENFQRFIQFQITVNIIAFLTAILSVVFDFQMPFTTIQLLWVNIIMDGPPALSLGLEPVRDAVLNRKPTNRNASIITKQMMKSMLLNAIYITGIIMVQMKFDILGAGFPKEGVTGPNEMQTVLFALFAFSALFNAFNCREFGANSILPSLTKNTIFLKIITVTAVAQIFVTEVFSGFFNAVPLSVTMWLKIILLSSLVIVVNEIAKLVMKPFVKKEQQVKPESEEKIAA